MFVFFQVLLNEAFNFEIANWDTDELDERLATYAELNNFYQATRNSLLQTIAVYTNKNTKKPA